MLRWTMRQGLGEIARARSHDADNGFVATGANSPSARPASRAIGLLAVAVLAGGLALAAPAAAQSPAPPAAVAPYTMTAGRMGASAAAIIGVIGAVIGGLALARSGGRHGNGSGRRGGIAALALGPIGLIAGGLVVATAEGGVGTGGGYGGGIVAMAVGLIAVALGGLALARSRTLARVR